MGMKGGNADTEGPKGCGRGGPDQEAWVRTGVDCGLAGCLQTSWELVYVGNGKGVALGVLKQQGCD